MLPKHKLLIKNRANMHFNTTLLNATEGEKKKSNFLHGSADCRLKRC